MPGAVLWLHGLGDKGTGGWSGAFGEVSQSRPGTIFQFPTAPEALVSYSGAKTTAWFDIEKMPVNCNEPEPPRGIEESVKKVHDMLDELVNNGVKAKYIVLGGFSQGGTLALLAGLSYHDKLGGIISVSGWCARRADVSTWISEAGRSTPVLMCFGDGDPVISYDITKKSSELLQEQLGNSIEILSDVRSTHMPTLDGSEMTRVFRFMTLHLPKKSLKKEKPVVRPQAALIFLHGSGDTGSGIQDWLQHASNGTFQKCLEASGVQLVFPNALAQPYTPKGGAPLTVWFDRERMAYDAPEDAAGVARSVEQIDLEIDQIISGGVPVQRVAVAGFSMGGCLALHVGLASGRHAGQLGAVACLSSFLSETSTTDAAVASRIAQDRDPDSTLPAGPPIFMAHGDADAMVQISWAHSTRSRLEKVGAQVPAELLSYPGLGHAMCEPELQQLADFILKHIGGKSFAPGGA